MPNNNTENNPLFGLKIGSTIDASTGKFGASVINNKNITQTQVGVDTKSSLSGESAYVYADQLNQASLSVSGSYGVSGISQVSASVSAYTGHASASSSLTTKITGNVQLIYGTEYINFNNLTPADLLSSLDQAPHDAAVDALDKFNALTQLLERRNLLDVYNNADIQTAVKSWYNAVESFLGGYGFGDGVVVGVTWGGMGTVTLEMSNKASAQQWKYGGSGSFSYAGTGAAVSVQAAYNGSQDAKQSDMNFSFADWSLGRCIEKQVTDWKSALTAAATNKLFEIKLLDNIPNVTESAIATTLPEFVKPPANESLTKKITEIKSLEGLEAFAMASAYEKAKKEDKDLSLADFMEKARQKANTVQAQQLATNVSNNNINVLEPTPPQPHTRTAYKEDSIEKTDSVTEQDPAQFIPLGVWIANWTDIFPWLATGILNDILQTDSAMSILKKQCMVQDMLTLSKVYRLLAVNNYKHSDFGVSTPFDQIADSFAQQIKYLKDAFEEEDAIQNAFNQLGIDAKAIYNKWNQTQFLRNAELGLGILMNINNTSTPIYHSVTQNHFVTNIYPSSSEHPQRFSYSMFYTGACSFLPNTKTPYNAFSSFYKVYPVVMPNGDIHAFGPNNMLLEEKWFGGGPLGTACYFSGDPGRAMKFQVNQDGKTLISNDHYVELFPIPFSAARGIEWKGESVSTNLSSFKSLKDKLNALANKLKNLNAYSFSSDTWKGKNWKPSDAYRMKSFKTQYMGIVDKTTDIFEVQS